MSILIGADIVPTKSNFGLFENEEIDALVDAALKKILKSADYRIFNLEVPLADRNTPIKKCGPNLIAPVKTAKGIKAVGADLLALANNHIMDQGDKGLKTTLKALEDNNLSFMGAGRNMADAEKPYVFDFKGKKIGVYACAENEFSIATENKAGANPFDATKSLLSIANLKNNCDYVIVLYHGGKEHYRYPSPNLQKTCRSIVDSGADIVICQHSHCIGCEEIYNNGTIVYGQGNFLFDFSGSEFWKTSVLIKINEDFEITYIPLLKNGNAVKLASDEEGEKILSEFKKRSDEIKSIGFVEEKYADFAGSMIESYVLMFLGVDTDNILWRILNKLSNYKFKKWYINRKYKSKHLLAMRNYFECEAHRELVIQGLKNLIVN